MTIHGSDEALATQLHPLVRSHPVTGRKALFVNEVYTIGLEGMTGAESAANLDVLFAQARQVSLTCRVRWAPGTLTMWDNRCTQHHAIDDYGGQRRVMYRATLAGERPR
jgi:taurine dioxygenase